MTRVGVIVRCEERGLGYQTFEVARHVNPDRVLLVLPPPNRHPTHPDWYDGMKVTTAEWRAVGRDYLLDPDVVRPWLDGLDVVYTAETLYDWRLARWAARYHCRVVCHVNPELLPPQGRVTDGVVWWAPTPWLLDRLPPGTRVVPMPVAADRIPPTPPRGDGPVRFVHVGGHSAMLDRNGTRGLVDVVRQLRGPCHLLVTSQDGTLPAYPTRTPRVTVETVPHGFPHYGDAFRGDVLVMPRRFGGLCLPVQEAMAAGMCVLMPAVSPNGMWPGPRFGAARFREVPMLGGPIPVCDPDFAGLRAAMDHLARDPAKVDALQADAVRWAQTNSWDALGDVWVDAFDEAAGR